MTGLAPFQYSHRVQFYETDLMGIVHHSNYLRVYEEARVAWAHARGILDYQQPNSAFQLAVVETRVQHLKPARFGDLLQIDLLAKLEGARIVFAYRMRCPERGQETLSLAKTVHAALDSTLKPMRPPPHLRETMRTELERYPWTETWLLNL